MPKFIVRSRETRVHEWEVEAEDAEAAGEWVFEQGGDTEHSRSDQFDSTEILDVSPA